MDRFPGAVEIQPHDGAGVEQLGIGTGQPDGAIDEVEARAAIGRFERLEPGEIIEGQHIALVVFDELAVDARHVVVTPLNFAELREDLLREPAVPNRHADAVALA